MIISDENKIIYEGNGVATEFSIGFKFIKTTDIKVALYDGLTKKTSDLTKDYFIDNEKNVVLYPGYQIGQEPPISEQPQILKEGEKLIIYRAVPITQEVDYGDKYPLNLLEKSIDKVTMILQDHEERIERSIKMNMLISDEQDLNKISDYAMQCVMGAEEATKQALIAKDNAMLANEYLKSMDDTIQEATKEATKEATRQAEISETYADKASQYASTAFAASAEAWNKDETYSYPTVVAYKDGNSYRCIDKNVRGDIPSQSEKWVKITLDGEDFFDIDIDGCLEPALSPSYSSKFELDEMGDIQPRKEDE